MAVEPRGCPARPLPAARIARRRSAATVFIPEGEKDVENLRALGCVATCNAMGAGKWRDEYKESLRGRNVAILPDNDTAGADHARTVASALTGIAGSVKVLSLARLAGQRRRVGLADKSAAPPNG